MRYLAKCDLLDKQIKVNGEKRRVLGLASYRTEPRGMGIGKLNCKLMEGIAEKQGYLGVFCFCFDDVVEFYRKCGWHEVGTFQGKHMFSSLPLKDVEAWETW